MRDPSPSHEHLAEDRRDDLPSRWSRVMLLAVEPVVDCGRHPAKRVVGEDVEVFADIVADGHEVIAAEVRYAPMSPTGEVRRQPVRMQAVGNDRYSATLELDRLGQWRFEVHAWIDQFATWQELFERRVQGGSPEWEIESELLEGAALLERSAREASGEDERRLREYIAALRAREVERALEPELLALASVHDPQQGAVVGPERRMLVERRLARTSSWYEFFPRSSGGPGEHATLNDAAERLDYVKELGFDIVYLPPIHPIGRSHRKGKDNAPSAEQGDPGSPWAIGNEDGGHKSVEPALGGLAAFDRFMAKARELELEVALDLAYQCSPDHPYTHEHPEWFRQRPDGSIRYAENPPKKYQDIYPINFESEDWSGLWLELRSVIEFWAKRGVRTFRVDNPHTKPLAFWEWCFDTLRERYPDLIFLAEAFTRPKVMYSLAKVGFSQSYTYFTWRYTKREFQQYLLELTQTDVADFFRPNFWPNTPDILPPYLRERPAFEQRLVLASTLSASYGIYGPAFERMANEPHPEREEYRNNEKYEIKSWEREDGGSLEPLIARINRIRRENPALHHNRNLRFHSVDNEQLMAYSKVTGDNLLLMVVTFDLHYRQSGLVTLPLEDLGIKPNQPYMLEDLLDGSRYFWQGARNYLEIDPGLCPARVFRIRPRVRREHDFDYFS